MPVSDPAFWTPFRLIAHRGASAAAPENTLAAIARAAELGARSVELDATLSRDGVPLLLHDETLNRTTNGRGPVAAQSWEALARLDAGASFSRNFAGEPLPTLAQAVALIRDRAMALNLEIKPSPGRDRETAAQSLAVLREAWPDEIPLLISSGSAASLEVARDEAPDWPRGLIVDTVPAGWRDRLARLGCVSLNCSAASVTPSLVDEVHAAGYRLLAWTVNRVPQARRLFGAGVDGVFTDHVAKLIAAFDA